MLARRFDDRVRHGHPLETRFPIRLALLSAGVLALPFCCLPARASAQEAPLALSVTPGFAVDEWLDSDARIELLVSPPLAPEAARLVVLLGDTDMTPLFTAAPERLTYEAGALGLPAGETEITVHLVTPDDRWTEIARIPIRVRTRGGFEKASFDPRLDLGNEGQVAEGHAPDESRPPRGTYQDLTTFTGFTTVHARDGWTVQTQFNATGVSHREKALRFAQEGEAAPRFDLSDYRIDVERGIVRASLGHVSFGGTRHLIDGFGSRGATLALRLGSRADLTTAWLHGSSIVGWSHFVGVDRRQHRMAAATLGLEAFPSRPGALRLEATTLRGSVLPLSGFNQGVVNDAEESRGWGLRLVAATPGQRGRVEAGYSRNRFDNPPDPFLSQGAELVDVERTTRGARYLETRFDVVPAWAITPSVSARLTAIYRHERVEPLYRTVAAFVQADRANHVFEIEGGIGELGFLLNHQRYRDNLDDVPSILITRGRDHALQASVPLAFLVRSTSRPAWMPYLSYRYQRVHQTGEGVPDNSGARPTFVPDQVSAIHGLGLDWQGARWRASWRIDRSSQDNRQPEREHADFSDRAQTVSLGFTPLSTLTLGVDLTSSRARNEEIDRTDRTLRLGLMADWLATEMLSLGTRWSMLDAEDDSRLRESGNSDLSVQLTHRLDRWRVAGWPLPGQVYFRFGRQASRSLDREFAFDDSRHNWSVNTGLSLTTF